MSEPTTFDPARLDPARTEQIPDPADTVLLWRIAQLDRAGFNSPRAVELAVDRSVDIHLAADLLQSGCPVETAVRILL